MASDSRYEKMNSADPKKETASNSGHRALRSIWLSPRRKRFWAILIVLVYTLGGFFLVPALVKHQLVAAVERFVADWEMNLPDR